MSSGGTRFDLSREDEVSPAMHLAENLKREVQELRALQISRLEDRATLLGAVERSSAALHARLDEQSRELDELNRRCAESERSLAAALGRLDGHDEVARIVKAAHESLPARAVRFLRRLGRRADPS